MKFRKLRMDELGRPTAEAFAATPKRPIVLLLDSIRSLHNVGALFRTADAFALESLALCGFTGTPPRRELHAAALGAEFTVPWTHHPNAAECALSYQRRGYRILALEQCEGSTPLHALEPWDGTPTLLLLGNEVHGVQQELLELCDACVEIPQQGTKHSLNVSTAAGIALWGLVYGTRRG